MPAGWFRGVMLAMSTASRYGGDTELYLAIDPLRSKASDAALGRDQSSVLAPAVWSCSLGHNVFVGPPLQLTQWNTVQQLTLLSSKQQNTIF